MSSEVVSCEYSNSPETHFKDYKKTPLNLSDGSWTIKLAADQQVTFALRDLAPEDRVILSTIHEDRSRNLFGFSEKTSRLPGHDKYSKK